MDYIIRELQFEDLKDDKGFFDTLSNLSEAPLISEKKKKEIFDRYKQNRFVYIAESSDGQIIGTITLMVEEKFYRGGAIACHIEDVIVRKGFEEMGIGKNLVNKALEKAKELRCYKVILSSNEKVAPFYKKLGFYEFEITMRRD